jgi:hypothetical protein
VPDLAGGGVDHHRGPDQPHRTGTAPTAPFGGVQAGLADGLPAERCVHVVLPSPRARRWEARSSTHRRAVRGDPQRLPGALLPSEDRVTDGSTLVEKKLAWAVHSVSLAAGVVLGICG